jgi:thiamine-phosphate pyrophosphorylase
MFKLMLITDRRRSTRPISETVRMALAGGVDAVQLREHDLNARELYNLAVKLRAITREAGAALIVNQRLDVALAVGADGVHLGWQSLSPADVRRVAGGQFLIGISCHDGPQIHSAEEVGANYALLGPVFHTPSKEGLVRTIGLGVLKELVSVTEIPVLALGGITPENAAQVMETGVAGLAAISALINPEDPAAAARAFRDALAAKKPPTD